MADGNTQFVMDEVEPMHIEPIYLSSNEDNTSQCSTADIYLTDKKRDQYDPRNQFLVQSKETTNITLVTISTYDSDLPEHSTSLASNAETF